VVYVARREKFEPTCDNEIVKCQGKR